LKEREEIEGGFDLEKGEKDRGVWAKCPSSSSPPSRSRTGQFDRGRPVEGRCPPAAPCTATAGKWGETKRSSRATHSASYLGRGQPVEVAPQRRAAAGYGGRWWWCLEAWEAGRLAWGGVWRGGEPRRAFYMREKVGSRRYFQLRGAPMAGNGGSGKIPAWTPAGGILGRFDAV
jgi:hypothetical protein